jgi:hypothetical protein
MPSSGVANTHCYVLSGEKHLRSGEAGQEKETRVEVCPQDPSTQEGIGEGSSVEGKLQFFESVYLLGTYPWSILSSVTSLK